MWDEIVSAIFYEVIIMNSWNAHEAVVIIEGWEKLAREDWPLSYLSDLDW